LLLFCMPLSAQAIGLLKEEANGVFVKISGILKLPTESSWTSSASLTVKDSISYLRGKDEAPDVHAKEDMPEYVCADSFAHLR
jgi:hypothetical protein